jgi:hypothetical protein
MYVLRSRVVRLGAVPLLAVAVMAAAYGFAATNTVPDTRAGVVSLKLCRKRK